MQEQTAKIEQATLPSDEISQDDLDLLTKYVGQEVLTFLKGNGIELHLRKKNNNRLGEIRNYWFASQGRVIEMFQTSNYPERVEISYSFEDDFLTNDLEKYKHQGSVEDLQQSMQFVSFMRHFLESMKKDAPLRFKTFDDKRKKLAEILVKSAGLTNVQMT